MWALGGDFDPVHLVQPGKRAMRRVSESPAPPPKPSLTPPTQLSISSRASRPSRHASHRRQRQRRIPNVDPVPDTSLDDVVVNATSDGRVIAFRVQVTIYGRPVKALVDSGATRTFLGSSLIKFLDDLGLEATRIAPRPVLTANSQLETIRAASEVPTILEGRSTTVLALHLSSLSEELILGLDYLRSARMVVDFFGEAWFFRDTPEGRYTFVPEERVSSLAMCCGLRTPDSDEAARLRELLDAHVPVIPADDAVTSLVSHHIDVGDSTPIKQKPYPVTPVIRDIMWTEVDRMLATDIIEPSSSDWASPVVMVKKPSGKYRFCIDYRKVNAVTKKDAYPIPNMTGILDELRQANYISTLDLSQAYWQVPMDPASREVTAFVVPGRGLFHFKRMPYGLTNAPATFQRMLDRLISAEMYPHVFVYLDDIIIVTRTFDEHLVWLRKVLEKISMAGLAINREKSEFCRSEAQYLGFLVNSEGLKIDPAKVEPVIDFPIPTNIRQLRRFLGMASWYRRFIDEFATIAEPLTRLTKKGHPWGWGPEQQQALDTLKLRLTSSPTLACPDFSLPFSLQTDASGVGLGAVLTQVIGGQERVIAYASRALTGPERKYSVTEQECLAVLWAIRKFRCYLEGYSFTVVTDHSSLRWLHHLKNPTGRLARWALELMEYDFIIVHRKGALHHVPDALSRIPEGQAEAALCARDTPDAWYRRRFRDVSRVPAKFPDWKIVDSRLYFHRPTDLADLDFEDLDAWKLVLPRDSRRAALGECHALPQAGHLGVEKTYRHLSTLYYWPGMFKDVAAYVRRCETCQRCKVEQQAPAGLMGHRVVDGPWMTIAADIMGPLTPASTGHAYVLVIQDLYTKWVEIWPMRKATGKSISKALDDLVVTRWGAPRVLLTDNGTEFVNRDIRRLTERVGIRHQTTPPYHPQANPTERVNRVVKTMIRAFLEGNHREWDHHLHEFRFAYNTAFHGSLQATPAFANFGREPSAASLRRDAEGDPEIVPRPPEEWMQRMSRLDTLRAAFTHALDEAFRRQSGQYNLRRRDRTFEVGDLVWRRSHTLSNAARHVSAALNAPFEGPFVISKRISRVVYELSDLDGRSMGKISVKDLKPYRPSEESAAKLSTATGNRRRRRLRKESAKAVPAPPVSVWDPGPVPTSRISPGRPIGLGDRTAGGPDPAL